MHGDDDLHCWDSLAPGHGRRACNISKTYGFFFHRRRGKVAAEAFVAPAAVAIVAAAFVAVLSSDAASVVVFVVLHNFAGAVIPFYL